MWIQNLLAARHSRASLLAFRKEGGHPGAQYEWPVSQHLDGIESTLSVQGGLIEPLLIAAELLAHKNSCGDLRDHAEHV